MSTQTSPPPSPSTATPRRRKGRTLAIIGGGLLLVVGGLVAFAPSIASSLAPGIITAQAGKFVKGSVKAQDVSLSWGGPQKLGPITWNDESGQPVVKASVSTSAGLLGLIRGNLDLGDVEVRDTSLTLVRFEDGTTNVQKLLIPQPQPAGGAGAQPGPQAKKPIQLPKGLKVRLSAKNVQATLIDQTGPGGKASPTTVELRDVQANVDVDPTKPLVAKLSAKAGSAGGAGAGDIKIDLTASNWADNSGVVTIDTAQVKGDVSITGLPMALLDALAGPVVKNESGQPVPLATALGPVLGMTATIDGNVKDAAAKIDVNAGRVTAAGEVKIAGGQLSTVSPLTIRAQGAALHDLVPALKAATRQDAQARVEALPDSTIIVDGLTLTMPQGGQPLDLRTLAVNASLELSAMRGSVRLAEGQPLQPMTIAPLKASVQTTSLGEGARITASTSATINNNPAGTISMDMQAKGLLDAQGKPVAGLPASLDGTLAVRQIATIVAQPFVQAFGLDLPRDIGPTLDLDVKAATPQASGPSAPGQQTINLDVQANAQQLRVSGELAISPTRLQTRAKGLSIEADAAGRIAQALTSKGEWRMSASAGAPGKLVLTITSLDAPLTSDRTPRLEALALRGTISTQGLAVSRVRDINGAGSASAPIDLTDVGAAFNLASSKARVEFQWRMAYAGRSFGAGGGVDVPDLFVAGPAKDAQGQAIFALADPITLRPAGNIEIVGLPMSLLAMLAEPAPRAPAEVESPPLDLRALLPQLVGEVLTVRMQSAPDAQTPGALALDITTDTGLTQSTTKASLAPTKVALRSMDASMNLSPQGLDALLSQVMRDVPAQERPRLVRPAQATLKLDPLTIPLDAQRKPKLAQAGVLKAMLSVPQSAMIENVKVSDTQRSRLGVQDLQIEIEAPVSSLIPSAQGGVEGSAKATLRGGVLGGEDRALAQLSGDASFKLLEAKPVQRIAGNLAVQAIDTRGLDALLAQAGLVSGALGDRADVTLTTSADATLATFDAQLGLTAPNVQTTGPLKIRALADRIELVQPARFTMQAQPSFMNALLTPKQAGNTPAGPAPLSLSQPTTIDLSLTRLVLPKAAKPAPGQSATKAPPPDVSLALDIPQLALRTSDNKLLSVAQTRVTLESDTTRSTADKPIAFALNMNSVQVQGAEGSGNVSLTGTLSNLVGPDGGFAMDGALLNARGQMPSVPTALVDVLAKKDGLLVEALGPIIELSLIAERYPLIGKPVAGVAPGLLDLQARSARATASIRGDISEGVLVCPQPVQASLLEITSGLAGRLVKGLPMLGTFEKKTSDRPAMITATGLRVPLSNDLSKLSGQVTIDPGEARFGLSQDFQGLLNLAKLDLGGADRLVGRRLDPLTITVTNGVASYPKWRLPLGEFTLESEGQVDLASKQIDVVTWVPLGALADEAAGQFNTGLGKLLGRASPVLEAASMLPFRTKGPMGSASTRPDLELFAQTAVQNLRPDRLIEKGLGDLLRGIGEPKKDPPK